MVLYNQSTVKRGKILLGFDVINNWWDTELKDMDKDKVVEPFHYPNTFLLLGYTKDYFCIPYRQTGELHDSGHAKGKVPSSIPDYTTINIEELTN